MNLIKRLIFINKIKLLFLYIVEIRQENIEINGKKKRTAN
jgi:hypothetical protein